MAMSELVYGHSEDLWAKAVESLKPELRELFTSDQSDRQAVLEVVLYAAQEKRELCIRKQWKITKKNGDIIILRDVFEKIIQCVDKFKALGNAAAEFAPGYASVPWGVIKMLLQTTVNDTAAFAAMVDGLEEVTSTIARCSIFEAVYLKQPTLAMDHLKGSLVSPYGAILNFLGTSYSYFSTNTGKRFMKATLESAKEIEDAIRRFRVKQGEVERTAQIASMEILHDTSTRMITLTTMVGSLSIQLETANSRLAILNPESQTALVRDSESMKAAVASIMGPKSRTIQKPFRETDDLSVPERVMMYDWLSSIRYQSHHQTETQGRLSGSGEWLFQSSEFLDWTNSSISGTLWLHGMPGCGKTKLASAVVDFDLARAENQSGTAAPIAYFYCAQISAETGRSEPDEVLRCIARQLCRDNTNLPVGDDLRHAYENAGKPQIGQNKLDVGGATDLILSTLSANPATIVIDALDELRPEKRHQIFECLDKIVKESSNVVKVFLTSRNDRDIVCRLNSTPNIYISAQHNGADIQRFIAVKLEKAVSNKRLLRGKASESLQHQIADTLNHGAQGMFRWVSLQIQNLCDPRRMKLEEDVLQELRQLPQSLSDLYAIAFDQICQLSPSSYEIGISALKLLLVAVRPITWDEVLHILQVSHTSIRGGITREELLDITCNFIDDDGRQMYPRFAHQSVWEYLETRPDFARGVSNARVAHMCLHHIVAPGNEKTRQFCYSTFYLGNHLSATVPEERTALRPLLERLLLPELLDSMPDAKPPPSELFNKWRRRLYRKRSCMMLAVILNRPSIVSTVRNLHFDVDTPTASGKTALWVAAKLGKPRMIRELLICGADPNQINQDTTEKETRTFIPGTWKFYHKADEAGEADEDEEASHADIYHRRSTTSMGFHVQQGNTREIQSPFYYKNERKSVIHAAMHTANAAECVKTLIDFGADVNSRTSQNVTSLQHCLEYGNLESMFGVFSILLKAGAEADAVLQSGRTIIHVVAAMGHWELIRQLLDIGADCSLRDDLQQSPLDLARRYGHRKTVELLESRHGAGPLVRVEEAATSQSQESSTSWSGYPTPSIRVEDYEGYTPATTQLSPDESQHQFTSFDSIVKEDTMENQTLQRKSSIGKWWKRLSATSK
ncbi:hypothetical protein QQX98_004050 [Neonectria punicea]|uniref:NACHT domain-containing protein n=1 Tax=Neonectria punicea TaxID=979145 RepID=A0ABR1HBD8_9HYPO